MTNNTSTWCSLLTVYAHAENLKKHKMKIVTSIILTILITGCQPYLKERDSDQAYKRGVQTLESLSGEGEPDYKKALEFFAQATTLNPENITAQYWKADTELKLGKFDESLRTSKFALVKCESKHRLRPQILIIAGLSAKKLEESGDEYFKEAVAIYEKRISENINDIDAIMNKGIVLCYMDKKTDAITFLNSLSLNEEKQTLLEQIKIDIQNFNADKVLDQITTAK